MAFCWHADDGPTLNAGLVAQGIQARIAKKLDIFVIFFFFFWGGGGGSGSGPSGSAHAGSSES